MFFEQRSRVEPCGKVLGFLLSFSIFTGIFYWVSHTFNTSLSSFSLIQIAIITCLVTLVGYLLREGF